MWGSGVHSCINKWHLFNLTCNLDARRPSPLPPPILPILTPPSGLRIGNEKEKRASKEKRKKEEKKEEKKRKKKEKRKKGINTSIRSHYSLPPPTPGSMTPQMLSQLLSTNLGRQLWHTRYPQPPQRYTHPNQCRLLQCWQRVSLSSAPGQRTRATSEWVQITRPCCWLCRWLWWMGWRW